MHKGACESACLHTILSCLFMYSRRLCERTVTDVRTAVVMRVCCTAATVILCANCMYMCMYVNKKFLQLRACGTLSGIAVACQCVRVCAHVCVCVDNACKCGTSFASCGCLFLFVLYGNQCPAVCVYKPIRSMAFVTCVFCKITFYAYVFGIKHFEGMAHSKVHM